MYSEAHEKAGHPVGYQTGQVVRVYGGGKGTQGQQADQSVTIRH